MRQESVLDKSLADFLLFFAFHILEELKRTRSVIGLPIRLDSSQIVARFCLKSFDIFCDGDHLSDLFVSHSK